MTKTTLIAAAMTVACASGSGPAAAHHSTAMFDASRTVTLSGTVKEFKLLNPHSWLMLDVADAQGATVTWRIEAAGPYALSRIGIKPGVVSPGATATVTINPMKNGASEGNLKTVTVGAQEFRIGGGG